MILISRRREHILFDITREFFLSSLGMPFTYSPSFFQIIKRSRETHIPSLDSHDLVSTSIRVEAVAGTYHVE